MLRLRVLFAALLLGACAPSGAEVAVSGAPPGPPSSTTVVAYAEPAPLHLALPPTTTSTTAAPTTTAPPPPPTTSTTALPVATTQPPAPAAADPAPAGHLHPAIAAAFGSGDLGHQAQRVAACESKLNPSAVSPTNDHGLFQINRPTWDKPHAWDGWQQQTGTSWSAVYDPYVNARFARQLYDRSGWGPWACRHAA
jgi:hypothetical protein